MDAKHSLHRRNQARTPILFVGASTALTFVLLFFISQYSFLLFHALAGFILVALSWGTFYIAWSSRKIIENTSYVFLGVAFLFVSIFDVLHAISYQDARVFPGYGTLVHPFWSYGRLLQAVSLLLAFVLVPRRIRPLWAMGGYVLATLIILTLIFTRISPALVLRGEGPTPYQWALYLLTFVLFAAAFLALLAKRDHFEPTVRRLLFASIVFSIVGSGVSRGHIPEAGPSILFGHYFFLISHALVFTAVAVEGISSPFHILLQELSAAEEKYRTIFQNAPLGIFRSTPSGKLLEANPRFAQMLGYDSPEEMLKTVQDLERDLYVFPERRKKVLLSLENGPGLISVEEQFKRKDGSSMDAGIHARAVFDSSGNVRFYEGMIEDISQRKAAEYAEHKRLQEHVALVENSPDIIGRVDREMRLRFVNPAVRSVTGISHEQFKNKRIRETKLPEEFKVLMENAVSETFKTSQEVQLVSDFPPGSLKRYYEHRFIPEFGSGGGVETVLAISRDITEQVKAEKELRWIQSQLENKVWERTRELEISNQAKSRFLANVSHEIRTPLSGIMGMISLLQQRDFPDDIRKDLRLVEDSAATLSQLINDILDLSKVEADKIELLQEDFNLREQTQQVVNSFAMALRNKNLDIELSFDPKLPEWVRGDPTRLAQILRNLLSNSIKFTEQGKVGLDMWLEEERNEQFLLKTSVWDTGIGIPEEKRDQLFQSFSQLDPGYSKRFGGTGLGLAISKRLAELMGGQIWYEPRDGGSRFSFTLTLHKTEPPEQAEKAAGPESLSTIAPLQILLAEDNKINQIYLTRFLSQAGHIVQAVTNGLEALQKLKEKQYDLILMDVQMPELDGLEATQRIRQSDSADFDTHIPIIALTAYAMEEDRERFLHAGMDGYVSKPVDFGELTRTIQNVINARSS